MSKEGGLKVMISKREEASLEIASFSGWLV